LVVACKHINPFRHDIGRLWSGLRHLTFPHAGAVVGVTGATEQFVRCLARNIPEALIFSNPQQLPPPPRPWPAGPTMIAVGLLGLVAGDVGEAEIGQLYNAFF
jgi:hypothetical protein